MQLSPFTRLTSIAMLGMCALHLGSCAGSHLRPTTATNPGPALIGSIAVVDEEKHFVLIDLESNLYVPRSGAMFRTVNADGATTGRVRIAPEEKRPFVAADIAEGNPAIGDSVLP